MCLAIPGRIESATGDGLDRCGEVSFGTLRKQVSLAFLPEAAVGDYVLVHVGVALQRLDPAEAARTLDLLEALALTDGEEP